MPANSLLDEALAAHAAGLVVMPVNAAGEYDKRPHLVLIDTGHRAPSRKSPGRWVPSWRPLMVEPPTQDMVVTWFRRPAGKGLAFLTGQRSGRVVIDLDGKAGDEFRQRWGVRPHVRTGSGGWHIHVPTPPWRVPTLNSKSKAALGAAFPGLDSRADGGYAILPPTVSRAGPYTWLRPLADLEGTEFLPVPAQVLLGLIGPPLLPTAPPAVAQPTPSSPAGAVSRPPPSTMQDALDEALRLVAAFYGRDNAGFWLARTLRDRGHGREDVKDLRFHTLVPGYNVKGEIEPYTQEHWEASVDSAFTRAPRVGAFRKPEPVATIDRLARVWLRLSDEERRQALRCVAASWTGQGEAARVRSFFTVLAVPEEVIAEELGRLHQQQAQGVLLPGLTALATRYLPAWERRTVD